jgi:hypothetical protein
MNLDIKEKIKEFYEVRAKKNELEKRESELREDLLSTFDSRHTDELLADDIRVYRVNHPKRIWDESALRSILDPKGLWEDVLTVDDKKVRSLIEKGAIAEDEIKRVEKELKDIWYVYVKRIASIPVSNTSVSDAPVPDHTTSNGKILAITDLSRMHRNRVCIFGIDEEGNPIRPVIHSSGITEDYLLDSDRQIIKPFSVVEFHLIRHSPKPPHTEDWEIDTKHKPRLIKELPEGERKPFLRRILDKSVGEIFGAEIHENRRINPGEGNRSLGTIKVKDVLSVKYSMKESGGYNYRITFSDLSGEIYNLPITDCAFRKCCDGQREEGKNTDFISDELQHRLNQSDLFLRVGLTRIYKDWHWLQISGLHAFPDYREEIRKES